MEELQNQFETKPSPVAVEEKKKKWVPFGFSEAETAQSEEVPHQIESFKQEPEFENQIIAQKNLISETPPETILNVKAEKVSVVEEDLNKPKSGKKEKVVVFKKRKTESAQQNLRERVDE